MSVKLTSPGSQPPPKPPATSNQSPQSTTPSDPTQEPSDKVDLTKSAALTLLKDTNWPPESEDAAQNLQRTINNLPNLPHDVSSVKDTVERFIHVLEAVYSTLKKASEKYGKKERGLRDMIKYGVFSLRRSKCTDILETGREDIENISTTLRGRLDNVTTIANPTSLGDVAASEMPSGHQNRSAISILEAQGSLEPLECSSLQAKTAEETIVSEHPTRQQALIQALPSNLPEDQENLNQVRAGALIVARRTFQTVEVVSGAIPVVGSYVGGVAKVGLAFVNMIETMDKSEDVVKELASHTSRLSTYLEHFKNKLDAEHGDVMATYIQDLHRELDFIEKKVSRWNSLGHFKKALLSGDHAEELKSHQDAVQTALEETQLLVSLKTTDLVIELRNTELRAERHRLLGCLGDGRYGARGNSIDDVVCLPGTRVEILDRINKWIKDTSASAERVLWIRGMAGHGKSTIASTVAHMWASKGSCAIFHFRRGHNASDDQFICALARQLGKGLVPEVKNAILDCVRENEDVAKERLDQQFKTLFVGSLGKLQGHAHPIIIIVDALDECENVSNAVRFVRLIDQHSSFLPINVKFLLTCRPEAPLLVVLEPRKWHAEDLDSVSHVFEDITRFIRHACAQIREDHGLPETWPSSSDVKRLVEMSQGLFQWARTAVTYVGDASPDHRLRELLQHSSKWGELDYLYNQILSKAFKRNSMRKQLLSWVLETLVVAPYPVSLEVITFLHADHEIFKGQEDNVRFLRRDILAELNSLLHIPTSPCEPLRLMHTSIRDLLVARERCEDQHYFVDLIRSNRRLANVSLGVMERDLRQNICDLSDLSRANSDVQHAVESHVPKGLQYSCRSWSIHLIAGIPWSEINGEGSNDVLSKLTRVSEEKLLAWLEVMGLIGATEEALTVAKQVHEWLLHLPREMPNGDMITLWNDTQRFIVLFLEPISFSALHIYASALPHCPMETKLWARYGGQATTRILLGERLQDWSANIWTSFADPSFRKPVLKVEFSPNGRALAAVLTDGEVHLLDTQTGVPVGNVGVNVDADGGQDKHEDEDKEKDKTKDEDGDGDEDGDEDNRCWNCFRLPRLLLRAARTWPAGGDPLTRFTQDIAWILFSPDSTVFATVLSYQALRLWDARTTVHLGDLVTGRLVTSLAFSPDSETLAAVLDSNTVRLWDARTGTQLSDPLTSHEGKITFTVFSPDGKVLASVSDAKTVQLWDTQTGTQLCDPLTSHEYAITSVVLSPGGKLLAFVLDDDKIQLWDARTRAQVGNLMTVDKDRIRSVVFLLDGEVVASMLPGNRVQLWDARTGVKLGDALAGREYCDTSIIFSPDGRVLASMPHVNTVQLWDARTGAKLGDTLDGQGSAITSVVFSPDGKVLASAIFDTVQLLDTQTGTQLCDPPTGHGDKVTSIAFSPDGKVLASGSYDKTVRLWDARTGAQLGNPLTGHKSEITAIAFSPDGKFLVSGSEDATVRLWDVRPWAQLGNSHKENHDIMPIVFSPDGQGLASVPDANADQSLDARFGLRQVEPLTGYKSNIKSTFFPPDSRGLESELRWDDQRFRLWDVRTGAQLSGGLTDPGDDFTSIAFSPDGKALAAVFCDTVQLWDARAGVRVGEPLTSTKGFILSAVFSPDSKVLALESEDGMVQLWDARTGAQLCDPLTGSTNSLSSIVFSPDSRVLAWGSEDKTVRLWNARTGAQMGDIPTGHTGWIVSVAFSPDGKVLASVSKDKTIRLWDARTGARLCDPLTSHKDHVSSVVFSPNSKVLASRSFDETVQLWDTRTGAALCDPLTTHGRYIRPVVFSPDSKVLASASFDETVQLWDAQTGTQLTNLETIHETSTGESLVFSPDRKFLASVSNYNTVRFWDPLTHQRHADSSSSYTHPYFSSDSNWILCNSKRLLWLPVHCRSREAPEIVFSHGSIAFTSDKFFSIIDVSRFLTF